MTGFLGGSVFIVIGYWLVSHGVHVVIGRYRQPTFSYSAIACGIVLILASAAPAWLIIKMTALKKYQPYQPGSHPSGGSASSAATKASFEKQNHENFRS
ncbi:MAG TPA: hypothetical protein VH024_04065 [Candidatus Angelobacter sp.]|jgi:hypothetical protein|nr:hypothetical protein [Candidatus Angelobacter sp.]